VKEWRPVDYNRRVEAPAERAVDNSRAGNKGVATKPGVPIPSRSEPARTPIYVKASLSDARFRQIFGSQRRLAEEIILVVAGVEIRAFALASVLKTSSRSLPKAIFLSLTRTSALPLKTRMVF